jgi:alpha-tubulin suppressor-like RCC1 family protein
MSTAVTPCNISNVVAVSCHGENSAALLADGTMRIWGQGTSGQLGTGGTVNQSTAVTPCNISNAVAIALGLTHTLALLTNGTIRGWGNGAFGRLGNNDINQQTTPVTTCNISNAIAIAAGGTYSAAVLADGSVRTWGEGTDGQLGYNSTTQSLIPVTPCNISNAVAIAAGYFHTAALLADGTMRTWGRGSSGQLGIRSTVSQLSPVTPCNISNVVAIAAGGTHTAALVADGTMRTWGPGSSGVLGIDSTIDMSSAVTPCNISNAVAIAAGDTYTAALLADGTMRTWGWNNSGRLGIGSTASQLTAVTPCNISNIMILRPIIKATTLTVYNNFYNLYQILADLSNAYQPGTVDGGRGIAIVGASGGTCEYSIDSGSTWTALGDVSPSSAVLLRGEPSLRIRFSNPTEGTLTIKAWSEQQALPALATAGVDTTVSDATIEGYSFGSETITLGFVPIPAPPVPTIDVSGVGNRVVARVTSAISPFAAGYTFDFNGVTYDTVEPVYRTNIELPGGVYTVKARAYNADLSASDYSVTSTVTVMQGAAPVTYSSIGSSDGHTAALLTDGTMRTWGRNLNGQLGIGSIIDMSTAVTPCNISNVTAIAIGGSYTAALLADGTMRTWGINTSGQLGIDSKINSTTPVTPCNLSNVVAITGDSAALLADGTMRTWGSGTAGRLGIGSTVSQLTPVTPCNVSNAIAISSSSLTTAALLSDGTMRIWGVGTSGVLGIGSTVSQLIAVTPCNVSNAVAIACGTTATAALIANGTMRIWGSGGQGRLGIGLSVDMSTAVTPCNISNAVAIALGDYHSVALLSDGTLRTWGDGSGGKLGIGSTTAQTTPVTPCNVSNCVAIAASTSNTMALLADGTIRIWGEGNNGRLGIGSTVDMSTAITPCNISNVMIVKPFRLAGTYTAVTEIYNNDQVSFILGDLSAAFWAGTVTPYGGIAVVDAEGSWEYSADNGTSWVAFPSVSAPSAVLLTRTARVRSSAPASGTDRLTVKLWSGQRSGTSAVVYTAVDTTITGPTIEGQSFSDETATLRNNPMPTPPPVPTDLSAVGGLEIVTVVTLNAAPRFVSAYDIDISGAGVFTITSMPSTIMDINAGTYSVRARTVNVDGVVSEYGSTVNVTVLPVPAPTTYTSIATGSVTAALRSDGTMRTWGSGSNGALGIGSLIDMSTAVTPCNLSNVISIASSVNPFTAALLADGTMRTWGRGSEGQLGHNLLPASQTIPVTPCNITNAIA